MKTIKLTVDKLSIKVLRVLAYIIGTFFVLGTIINIFTVTMISDALLLLFIALPIGLISFAVLNGFATLLENNLKGE